MKRRTKILLTALSLAIPFALFAAYPCSFYEVLIRRGPGALHPWALKRLEAQGDEALPAIWSLLETETEGDPLGVLDRLSDNVTGLGGRTRGTQLDGILLGLRSRNPHIRFLALERLGLESAFLRFRGARLPSRLSDELRARRNAAIIALAKAEDDPDNIDQATRLLWYEGFEVLPDFFAICARPEASLSWSGLGDVRALLDRLAKAEPARFEAWLEEASRDPSLVRLWILGQRRDEDLDPEPGSGSAAFDARILPACRAALVETDETLRRNAARILAVSLKTLSPDDAALLLAPLTRGGDESPELIEEFLEAGLALDPQGFYRRALAATKAGLENEATRRKATIALVWLGVCSSPPRSRDQEHSPEDRALWSEVQPLLIRALKRGDEGAEAVARSLYVYPEEELLAAVRALLDHPKLRRRLTALISLDFRLDEPREPSPELAAKRRAIMKAALASEDRALWRPALENLRGRDLDIPGVLPLVLKRFALRYWRPECPVLEPLRGILEDSEIRRLTENHQDPAIREGARQALEDW